MPNLKFSTVLEQRQWVAEGKVTARDLVEYSLARIAKLDPVLNAFAHVRSAEARAEADALDASGPSGGPLHGVPIAIKDENDVAGLPTAYGGASVTEPAAHDSEVVRRLRAAGAIIIGKTRMSELGIWPFTETDAHGVTRNPWNPQRSTAGSSGGTAAAVAAGLVAAGIGGDGGGSIRLPASWCGFWRAMAKATPVASYTSLWNVLGNPAAAVPVGFTDDGLPLSAQLIAPAGGEATLISVCAQLERAHPWASRRPSRSASETLRRGVNAGENRRLD